MERIRYFSRIVHTSCALPALKTRGSLINRGVSGTFSSSGERGWNDSGRRRGAGEE